MLEDLASVATRCDRTVAEARAELVSAVRRAYRQGLTQQQIALQTGRSQPEIHRLLRFHGMTPLGRRVAHHRTDILNTVESLGGSNVRVFGSVALGRDDAESDIDILYTPGAAVSMMTLARAEKDLSTLLRAPVELVADTHLAPWAAQDILEQAVPL